MTKEGRDKFLTEQRGECWHEWSDPYSNVCDKCNNITMDRENDDFSTWEGFGKLKEFMEVHPYWDKFVNWVLITYFIGNDVVTKMTLLFSKERFADICYKFLRENPH